MLVAVGWAIGWASICPVKTSASKPLGMAVNVGEQSTAQCVLLKSYGQTVAMLRIRMTGESWRLPAKPILPQWWVVTINAVPIWHAHAIIVISVVML